MASGSGSSYSSDISKIKAKFALARKKAVLGAANEWRNGIVSLMTESTPSGRVYPVEGTQRYYRASAPGEPPAVNTGQYRASWRPPRITGEDEASVGTHSVIGLYLEKGTENMAPRPHVRQGYEHNRVAVRRQLTQRWDKGLG